MPQPADHTITGTIETLHDGGWTGRIRGDDGHAYFLLWKNLSTYSHAVKWADVRVGMRVRFIPVESDRRKDDPPAIEVTIIEDALDNI
jgi:hypothetical protein